MPDDDLPMPPDVGQNNHWHESFCRVAREWISTLSETELLILGLRLRYRMTQREVAQLLGVHEGTISRQTAHLRSRCFEFIEAALAKEGWTGDDLADLVRNEMGGVLLDESRLSADRLAGLLRKHGKSVPSERSSC
jgi:hypothetical protein